MEYFKDCVTTWQLEQEHRRLVIQLHPDRNPNDPEATAKFQEMQAQYEERKAELNGDYTKARKGRERRERERKEREERERKERERRKVEMAVEQARKNKQKSHLDWKVGEYVYAWKLKGTYCDKRADGVLEAVLKDGVNDETVVMIEQVFTMTDDEFFRMFFYGWLDGDIYGGWDVLQKPDPVNGIHKERRVAKVVMFRSEHYCMFGNPKGDQSIGEYYMPSNYGTMFRFQLDTLIAKIAWERQEQERIEAERKAKLLAEQKPLIEEWKGKLIELSAGLSSSERLTVAMSNFKQMLKDKFPGSKFSVKKDIYGDVYVRWEDGPMLKDVCDVMDLFDAWKTMGGKELTPWMECYGKMGFSLGKVERKMSVLTKARILQQLGSVTEAFSTSAINDEVTVTDFDWMMLHLLVGIEVGKGQRECMSTMHADGSRTVSVMAAVRFVFQHSSYAKATKTKTKTKKAA